jgi:hypothetical protein
MRILGAIRLEVLLVCTAWILVGAVPKANIIHDASLRSLEVGKAAFVPQLTPARPTKQGPIACSRPLVSTGYSMCSAQGYHLRPVITTTWPMQQAPSLRLAPGYSQALHASCWTRGFRQRGVRMSSSKSGKGGEGSGKKKESSRSVSSRCLRVWTFCQ